MTVARQLRATLALALFVGVSLAVPVADAIWYHASAEHATARHIESADGPACHAEACVLGAPAAAVSPVPALVVVPRFEQPPQRLAHSMRDDIVRARLPVPAPPSRGPPEA